MSHLNVNAPIALCVEPGCGKPSTGSADRYDRSRCDDCHGLYNCATRRCPNRAALGILCRACAAREHPGCVWFRRRWITLPEFHAKIQGDPSMRRVTWQREGSEIVGRDGTFEIRLKTRMLWSSEP